MALQKDLFPDPRPVTDDVMREVVEIYRTDWQKMKDVVCDMTSLYECNSAPDNVYTAFCHLRTIMIGTEKSVDNVLQVSPHQPSLSIGDILRQPERYRPDRG